MTKRFVPVLGVILGLMMLVSGGVGAASRWGAPDASKHELMATLSGAEEVPGPGDADGSGSSTVTINSATEICFTISVSAITLPAAAAHIHEGAKGVAGGVVVPLTAPDANGKSEACATADAAVVTAIQNNPANYYVNVHTSDYPQGAVRGQLTMKTGDAPANLPATGADNNLLLLAGLGLLLLLGAFTLLRNARRTDAA